MLIYLFSTSNRANTVLSALYAPAGSQADFSGTISKITSKQSGCTLSVCDLQYKESCISVSVNEKVFPSALLEKGNAIHVKGTIKQLQYAVFVDANEITLE